MQAAAATAEQASVLTMQAALALAEKARSLKDVLPGLNADAVGVQRMTSDVGERVSLVAARDVRDKEVGLPGQLSGRAGLLRAPQ
jgi:hypothetical protein